MAIIDAGRLIRFILIGTLLLQMGCAKTVSIIRPVPHQDPGISIPCKVEVTLKSEDKVSGTMVAWEDKAIYIRTVGDNKRSVRIVLPVENIEKIEVKEEYRNKPIEGCLKFGCGCLIAMLGQALSG